jgi:flagellar export protein FliJ
MSDFRFNRLIEIKEKLLEQKERDLEVVLASQAAVVEEMGRVDAASAGVYAEMANRLLTGKELSMLTDQLAYLDWKRDRLHKEKEEWERKAALLRKVLLSLEMELKVFEKLRFRARKTMEKVRNRKEQKMFDELALRSQER